MLVGMTAAYVVQTLTRASIESSGEEDYKRDRELEVIEDNSNDAADENVLDDIAPSYGPKVLMSVTLPSQPGMCFN